MKNSFFKENICACVFEFNVTPTAKVIKRWGHGLKSHRTDWRSRASKLLPLVYKGSGLSTTPQWLLTKIYNPSSYDNVYLPSLFTGGSSNIEGGGAIAAPENDIIHLSRDL